MNYRERMFLPKLLRIEEFDSSKEPFQTFDKLVGWRNLFVHHKGKKYPWDGYNSRTSLGS